MLDAQQSEERLKGDPKEDEDLALVQLWILADKLVIPELQNLVIDKIDEIREATEIVPTAVLDSVYAKTSVESPFVAGSFTNALLSSSQIGLLSILNISLRRCSSNWQLSGAAI